MYRIHDSLMAKSYLSVKLTSLKAKNELQRYTAQHREYSQYFIITVNGI